MINTAPGFTREPIAIGGVRLTAANTNSDGTGNLTTPTIFKVCTADATNGSFIDFVRLMATATAAGTATTATVIRFYLSSITSGATTNANTFLFKEYAVPSVSADSATVAQNEIDIPFGIWLPAGNTILASTHAAPAANTAWIALPFGGDF